MYSYIYNLTGGNNPRIGLKKCDPVHIDYRQTLSTQKSQCNGIMVGLHRRGIRVYCTLSVK